MKLKTTFRVRVRKNRSGRLHRDIKKAFEKGINKDEITVLELVEELKEKLRQVPVS